ncbi:MAG: pyridoxal phosphate-dependent aminotransferase [Chloroflexi bacterium]|nr:pyridoxal phosphate-dependent aminotransferase [Chloroflexota bacterium]
MSASSGVAPQFVVPPAARVPVSDHLKRMQPIPPSRMFLVKQGLRAFRERHPDRPTYDASQGDGGASLPGVPRAILERAAALQIQRGTGYTLPSGTTEFRRALAETYWALAPDIGWGPDNIVATVGGRDGLVKAYQAALALGHGRMGDVVVTSAVPWISYNWGPYGVGANVVRAAGHPDQAWAYTRAGLDETFTFVARHERQVAMLIITSPDNPTGRVMPLEQQIELGRWALEHGAAFVLYDWIYHYVTDHGPSDINALLRGFDADQRERVMVLDGATKALGASNIRIGWLTAGAAVTRFITARASHSVIPSYYAQAVVQAALEYGYTQATRPIVEPTAQSRAWLRDFLTRQRMRFVLDQGYYAFINVQPWLEARGWADTEPLGQYLAEEHGLAIVPGVFFSPAGAHWIRFSYALPPERTQAAAQRLVEALAALQANA